MSQHAFDQSRTYQTDKQWSDRFIPIIRRIVGPHLLEPSPLEIDQGEATDLMLLTGKDMRIGARVRKHGFADRYPYEFTIRSSRPSGAKTELKKLTGGWCDWLFYGHEASANSLEIDPWWIINLDSWRDQMIWSKRTAGASKEMSNSDGVKFRAFDIRKFDPDILIAHSAGMRIVFEGWRQQFKGIS